MKGSGIYKIYSLTKPERVYIGSSINIKDRKRCHFKELKTDSHRSQKLQRHYNKYGKDDLVFVIIEPCFPEFLIVREQYYLDTIKPYFNTRTIAESNQGLKRSEEAKQKIREARARQIISDDHKRMVGDFFRGKKLTEEHKAKLRKPKSEAHRKKISEAKKGCKNPMYGKRLSEEHRRKISEGNKKRLAQLN